MSGGVHRKNLVEDPPAKYDLSNLSSEIPGSMSYMLKSNMSFMSNLFP